MALKVVRGVSGRFCSPRHLLNLAKNFGENDIFVEFNSEHHTPANLTEKKFQQIETLIRKYDLAISVGSDAHSIFAVGDVKYLWELLEKNDLLSRLIFDP